MSAGLDALIPLADILTAELERLPYAPGQGTLTERLEDCNRALVVPFHAVVEGTNATVTAVLARVVVYFDGDVNDRHTSNIDNVLVDPDVMVWGPARKQRSALSIARREGLRKSAARRKPKPQLDVIPAGWLPFREAVAATGISLQTLRTMIADGRVPSRRVLLPGPAGPAHPLVNRIVDVDAAMRLRPPPRVRKGDAS